MLARRKLIGGRHFTSESVDSTKDAKAQRKADKAYAKATRPWFKKKRFWLLGVIAVGIMMQVTSGGSDSGNNTASVSNSSSEQAEDTPVAPLTITAKKLLQDLEDNPLAAKTNYKDKIVQVTGRLSNIDASGKYFSLDGGEFAFITNVTIDINEEQAKIVSGFKMGQDVTVTAKITDVGEIMGYSLDAISFP